MKRLIVLAVTALLGVATVANAAIINFGVDVRPKPLFGPTPTAQVGFYDGQIAKGGDNGATLSILNQSLSFSILTPGLTLATINGFELFIDATDVDCNGDGCDGDGHWIRIPFTQIRFWTFDEDGFETGIGGFDFGYLQDTPHDQTYVPVEGGPLGTHAPTPYGTDVDNTFFVPVGSGNAAFAGIASAIQAGSLGITVDWADIGAGSARIDGVNLQVDYTPASTPEPVSLLLLGIGLVAAGRRFGRR